VGANRSFAAALPFPDARKRVEWVYEGGTHIQWRDRAGWSVEKQ
jgi:hypothetical protein